MVTLSAKERDPPLNVEAQHEWLEIAKALHGCFKELQRRVKKENWTGYIRARAKALDTEGRTPRDPADPHDSSAWIVATKALTDVEDLELEIRQTEASLKQHAAESEATP